MASDCADWMNPRDRSVYFSIFIFIFPRHAAIALKARLRHLHWVSAVRIDIRQPPAVVALGRLDANMGIGFPERKGSPHKIASGGAAGKNPLIDRMPEPTAAPAKITGLYRYPVKGL